MASSSMANVARSGLSADSTVTKRSASNHSDSSLTTSRVTLVDTDRNLALDQNSKYNGELGAIASCPPRYTWVDHLLGVFCINVSKRKVHNEYIGPGIPTSGIDPLAWPSPWILPVYVYPKAHNKGEAPIPNVAKCTIDTGNLQGNIVSREFVEDVLGYSATDIHKLTKEEERGGTAITGDLHMPQGAIYLTWYHRNSTRVFRNMRFLVSPYGGCDLIIGARSIKQDKILNVPCLMNNIIISETVSARPAGELHGKIWNIKNHITSTLQDDIDAKEEDGEDTKELENRKSDLNAIYQAFSNIWNILFGPGAENQDLDQKKSAADVEFGEIFAHPVSDMLKRDLELKEIEDGLKAELKYAQQIAPYDNNGDQNSNLRKRA